MGKELGPKQNKKIVADFFDEFFGEVSVEFRKIPTYMVFVCI